MNTSKRTAKSDLSPRLPRWLVAAGIAVGLMAPLSASADHNGNGVVEVLASAAVAYVVIDAVGGFDDNDRRQRKSRYRHNRHHDRDYRWGRDDRRYWAHRDQRRHQKHGHRNTHRRHHASHHRAHRYGSGHYNHRRDGRRHRRTAYH